MARSSRRLKIFHSSYQISTKKHQRCILAGPQSQDRLKSLGNSIKKTHNIKVHDMEYSVETSRLDHRVEQLTIDTSISFRDLIRYLANLSEEQMSYQFLIPRSKASPYPVDANWRPSRDNDGRLCLQDFKRACHLAGFYSVSESPHSEHFLRVECSKANPPKVLIGMPTYKSKFLEAALRDILLQSYPNLILVISDDGENKDLIARIAKKFGVPFTLLPDIQSVQDPNDLEAGVYYSNNENSQVSSEKAYHNFMRLYRLFREFRGFAGFLHDDDRLGKHTLEMHCRILTAYPELAFTAVRRKLIDYNGNPLPDDQRTEPMIPKTGISDAKYAIQTVINKGENVIGECMALMFTPGVLGMVLEPFKAQIGEIEKETGIVPSLDFMLPLRVLAVSERPMAFVHDNDCRENLKLTAELLYRQHPMQDSKTGALFNMTAILGPAFIEMSHHVDGLKAQEICKRLINARKKLALTKPQEDYLDRYTAKIKEYREKHGDRKDLPFAPIFADDLVAA
ncbi:MAG: glycosyltransferase family 2 protein [Deltaproteobacteria bacterium]|nr:glycosyltransferase family 2 protein [Deltaproteobacteria bacterium]